MTMILRTAIAAMVTAACCSSITAQFQEVYPQQVQEDPGSSYTTDVCISVIAIAGSPDYRYLEENGIEIDDGEEFVCELNNGNTVPIWGTKEQMEEMRSLLNTGSLVSAETSIGISDNLMTMNDNDSGVLLPPGKIILDQRKNNRRRRRRMASTKLKGLRSGVDSGRNLAVYEGDKPVLVVRVTDKDGKVTPDNARFVSDKIFGTYGDKVTMSSQFAACSFGKLQVTNEYDVDISKHLAAPGVINVDLPIRLSNSDRLAVRNAATKAVEDKLGFELPGPFQHVMFVLEACYTDCGWAGYAYVNSWLSIYQGDYYKMAGVQLHEVGHNLNLAHSGGLDGKTYTDHTCLMGNPLYGDDVGSMCFNPAKNFQIATNGGGWYNEQPSHTKVWNSKQSGGTQWSGSIIGVADYNNNPASDPIVVKLETGTPNDIFVGFNRAKGINSDNVEASDEVTVVEAGSDGLGYSQSFLKATLKDGESYTFTDWRGSGETLVIHVAEINMSANPAYAKVVMTFGDSSTNKPTQKPTSTSTIMLKCGDLICDVNENSESCPTDCASREIETTFLYNLGSSGNMFSIKAKRDISISSLAINSNSRGYGAVKVYTRAGSYTGHEQSSAGWDMVYDNVSVKHNRRGQATDLGDLDSIVFVAKGSTQSFFVTSTQGLVYKGGNEEFAPTASDESMEILEGIGTDGEFEGKIFSPRIWGGKIWYDIGQSSQNDFFSSPEPTSFPVSPPAYACGDSTCSFKESTETCPIDCAGKEIETTFEYNVGSSGNMFVVRAKRDIAISSFAINPNSRGYGAVKVYTRAGNYTNHEQSSVGWDLIFDNPSVKHKRRGMETDLGDFQNQVIIAGGSFQSFFVTSSKGMVYQMGEQEFAVFESDESMEILEGIGTDGEFEGKIFSPMVWGGKIRYDMQ